MLPRLIGEDIELGVSRSARAWAVKADPVQIEQVIMNLAVNARDAMPRGGTLTIETGNVELDEAYAAQHAESPPGRYVMLAVTRHRVRHGRGDVSAAHLRAVLHHQGSRQGNRARPGDGIRDRQAERRLHLGLQRAGLRNDFQDLSARGAIARAKTRRLRIAGATVARIRDDPAGGRRRGGARVGPRVLAGCGYNVLTACHGEEGLAVAENCEGPIALLVTDVVMPKLGGCELAQRIAAERPDIRVLYISGYTENTLIQHGVRELGTMFLQKPFTLKALAGKIREVLDQGPAGATVGVPEHATERK